MAKKIISSLICLFLTSPLYATHPLLQEVADGEKPNTIVIPDGIDQETVEDVMKMLAQADPNAKYLEGEASIAKNMSTPDLQAESTLLDKKLEILGNYENDISIKSTESLIFWTAFHENASRKLKASAYVTYAGGLVAWGLTILPLPCDVQNWSGIASGVLMGCGAALHFIGYKSEKAHKQRSKEIKREMDLTKQTAGIVDREIARRKKKEEPLIPEEVERENGRVWEVLGAISKQLSILTSNLEREDILGKPGENAVPQEEVELGNADVAVVIDQDDKGKNEENE